MNKILSSAIPLVTILPFIKGCAWIYFLSPPLVKKILNGAVYFLLVVFRYRRKVIEFNMEVAKKKYPDLKVTLSDFYAHFSKLIWEILYLFGPLHLFSKEYAKLVGVENYLEAKKTGRPILILASHLGNWEVMTAHAGVKNIPILMVTKKLKPEWLHRRIEIGRHSCGVKATYEPHTMRNILKFLRVPGNGVGIILDQYMGPPFSVNVPFFGIPVGTSSAFATIAKRVNAVILPCDNRRKDDGTFEIFIHPELKYDPTESIEAITARCSSFIESRLVQNPAQWLWSHRRFKGHLSFLDKPSG